MKIAWLKVHLFFATLPFRLVYNFVVFITYSETKSVESAGAADLQSGAPEAVHPVNLSSCPQETLHACRVPLRRGCCQLIHQSHCLVFSLTDALAGRLLVMHVWGKGTGPKHAGKLLPYSTLVSVPTGGGWSSTVTSGLVRPVPRLCGTGMWSKHRLPGVRSVGVCLGLPVFWMGDVIVPLQWRDRAHALTRPSFDRSAFI